MVCPDCGTDLLIDAVTGEVLHREKAASEPAGGHTFDSLLKGLDDRRNRAEELFEQEKAALKDRGRLLEEKFDEALKRAEDKDDGKPPPSPFDFD